MNATPTRFPRGALLPLATVALLALAGGLAAAPRFVMEIRDRDGSISIPGESNAAGHEGAIDVVSFGKSYHGSRRLRCADTTSVELGIVVDKALPKLLGAMCARRSSLAQVDIFYLGDDSRPISSEAAHMRLEHVRVSGVNTVIGEPNPLGFSQEAVAMLSLTFSKVTWTYEKFDPVADSTVESSNIHVAYEPTEDPNFDDDGDGLDNAADADDDNDGIPDSYETANGTDALADDADADPDHDKRSNEHEWLAGTRANDGSSFFAIESLSIEQGPAGRTATISFPVIGDRHYRLLGTHNPGLPRADWTAFETIDTDPGSLATQVEVVLDPAVLPQLERLFFVVEVDQSAP